MAKLGDAYQEQRAFGLAGQANIHHLRGNRSERKIALERLTQEMEVLPRLVKDRLMGELDRKLWEYVKEVGNSGT